MVKIKIVKKGNRHAFGGPISGALDYLMATDMMNNYNARTNANSRNILQYLPGVFAFGGDIQGNGSDFPTGMTHINKGGTHEESPYEGVPMGTDDLGTPNLVEENEVIYNDYVFSARLTVPKIEAPKDGKKLLKFERVLKRYSGLTYADAAKKAEKSCGLDERPNDPIAKQGFEDILEVLAQSQEKERYIKDNPDRAAEIRAMSDEEFTQMQQEQEAQEQMAQMQEQAQQQQGQPPMSQEEFEQLPPEQQQAIMQQMQQQGGQQGQPSPEEMQAMQGQGMPSQGGQPSPEQMAQQGGQPMPPQMADGGLIFAEGGNTQEEQAQQQISPEEAAAEGQGNPTEEMEQPAETEDAAHAEPSQFNAGTPAEEMSTSQLNETIEEIYQYAKETKDKDLLRRARKAKRGSRDEKEEFVDDAREDIQMAQEEQAQAEQEQAQAEEQAQAQAQQEQEAAMQEQQQVPQEAMATQADAGAELDAQDQAQAAMAQQFDEGGKLSEEELLAQMQQLAAIYQDYLKKNNSSEYSKAEQELSEYFTLAQSSGLYSKKQLQLLPTQYYYSRAGKDSQFVRWYQQQLAAQQQGQVYAYGGSMNLNNPGAGNSYNGQKVFGGTDDLYWQGLQLLQQQTNGNDTPEITTSNFDKLSDRQKKKITKALDTFLQRRGVKLDPNSSEYKMLLEEQATTYSNSKISGSNIVYDKDDITKNGKNIQAFSNAYAYNNRANNQYYHNLSGRQYVTYDGKTPLKYTYTNAAGNPIVLGQNESYWTPTFVNAAKRPVLKDGKWDNGLKDADVFTQKNGYYNYNTNTGKRDWSKFGYYDPKDNVWHDVVYNPPTEASGNGDRRYTPWNQWFKDSKMDIDKYEGSDAYIDNYMDFVDAINSGDKAALARLYQMGEATKSNNPKETFGKNRYFKDNVDPNNLTLNDIRLSTLHNGENVIGSWYLHNVGGVPNKNGVYADQNQYYINSSGHLVSERSYLELSDKDKKRYSKLENKGITRDQWRNHLKAIRNSYPNEWDALEDDLLFQSSFDNNPAQSYLEAPLLGATADQYALVNEQGQFIDRTGKVVDTPYYIDNYDASLDATKNPYKIYNDNAAIGDAIDVNGTKVYTRGLIANGQNINNVKIGDRIYTLSDDDIKNGGYTPLTDEERKAMPQYEASLPGSANTVNWYKLDANSNGDAGLDGTQGTYEQDKYVMPSSLPLYAGAGLQAAGLAYNLLNKPDYSNADALINASKKAGEYMPVAFKPIGEYVPYTPYDINYVNNQARNANQAAIRQLLNTANGNAGQLMAGLLALNYNYGLGIGQNYRQAMEYNDQNRLKSAEFNRGTDQYNSEGDLKAQMANQEAKARASQASLEGLAKGYAMREQIDQNRANAINAGINGVAQGLFNAYQLDVYNKQAAWRLNHQDRLGNYYWDDNGNPISWEEYQKKIQKQQGKSNGGRLRTKRYKGLSI